ncbi:MAG: 1-deoxy-D-xylulose-5-phosphate synthase [Thermoanaerobaculia bacterium]|nr:MAG: 1-deoxy-D-xylulose-5-phosphate synthase [Thermoanaerobaculia bacterium]
MTSPLLDQVHSPVDLRRLEPGQLEQLADELREEIVACVSKTGGHFSSNLGSVELTIALHYLFDTPRDLLVWDVGHQTYPHKILTGRRDRMETLRQFGGLSGFCLRSESEYDVVAAGHASTSISAALGLAVARDLRGESHNVVAIIGDGSMTAGMAFEAMNQAGHLGTRLVVVLNDNSMSISPSVGALTKYLEALMAGRHYAKLKDDVKKVLHRIPGIGDPMLEVARGLEEGVRQVFTPGTLFEELGFRYVGPVNGHSVPALLEALAEARDIDGPVLVHAVTKKGKGYKYAEDEPVEYHGPSAFDPVAGIQKKKPASAAVVAPSYTSVFGKAVIKLAEHDPRIVAITASMPDGTGLVPFSERFPDRFLNTGIAEQHSVTLAGGLALGGVRPVVAIYSSFLQRGFDQIFHDVCLMDLPVTFALDRGGIAGNDGWTHHGLFDFAYFRIFPNTIVMAPKDENELQHMLATAVEQSHPTALRYPRGNGVGVPLDAEFRQLPIGKAEVLRRGRHGVVWAIGSTVHPALEAVERLSREGIELGLVNARFVKPLDRELLRAHVQQLGGAGARLATVEEHVVAGGFGSAVSEALTEMELHGAEVLHIGVPDKFIPHGSQEILRKTLGLDADGLYFRFRTFFARGLAAAPKAQPAVPPKAAPGGIA